MLQTLKRLAWGEKNQADLPRTFAPGKENDAYWSALFQRRCQPHGRHAVRAVLDFNPRALPRGEAWLIDARFPFSSSAVVEKFLAWASALVRVEDLTAEAARVKAIPADLEGAVRFFMQRVRDERAVVVSELLSGVDSKCFYDPSRRGFRSIAGLLAASSETGLDDREEAREGAGSMSVEPRQAEVARNMLTFAGRMYLFSLAELDVSAWLAANPPGGETISDEARAAKLSELQTGIDSAKAEAEQLGQASGRIDGEGRDIWLGHYYAARILNAASAAPCDSCGREADEKTVEALDALGIDNCLRDGGLFKPTAAALKEFE